LIIIYPDQTGRNFSEILRAIDSIQLSVKHKVCTPANWQYNERCMVLPSVKQDEFQLLFPDNSETLDLPSGRPYIRFVNCPKRDFRITTP
jgi:hypothetical protein